MAAAQDRLARWVHVAFARQLSVEDAADVAAETIAEVQRFAAGRDVSDRRALLRTAARRNALDLVRSRRGEAAAGPRRPPASLDALSDRDAGPATADLGVADLFAEAGRSDDVDALFAALESLPADERRLLMLRHIDGLNVATCAFVLELSVAQYERRHTHAMSTLRDALASLLADDSCTVTRDLIDRGLLELADAGRRDAHLAGCLSCRAYGALLTE